jgi:hypothetical protein
MTGATAMDTTVNLKLPYIMPSQAQKHVTHNEALRLLDAILHISVASRKQAAPPELPPVGTRYLLPAASTGAWEGHDDELAAFMDDEWFFFTPQRGWIMHIADENILTFYSGVEWQSLFDAQPMLGVNTSADAVNRLAVASASVLLTHEGAGHQLKINKNQSSDTATLLFQSGWNGYAEMGLPADLNFTIKVADDSGNWQQAVRVDHNSGKVAIGNVWPTVALHVAGAIRIGQANALSLPSAAECGTGTLLYVESGGTGKLAYCDGALWRWVQDNVPVN